ncbi:MAG TPA: metallophosphoesterase, partial [Candidatus Nanoarchaeia archaeon]|nr:metallophosphoesterase [Candidatus Nanoarchaeia archaeon]
MKILIFSDVHLDEYALMELSGKSAGVDLCVCAGDLSRFGNGLKEVIEFLGSFKKEVLLVPGNNDPIRMTQELCEEYGITFIHKAIVKRGGFSFAGLGAGLVGRLKTPFELSEADFKKALSKFKGVSNLVLVTHTPPFGELGEVSVDYNIGSNEILSFIKSEQPVLCVTGHAHEHAGSELMIGKTRVINPG